MMNYHNITKCDMLNGEGVRVVLWVSGCVHACPNCHNQQTWSPKSGIPFDDDALNEIYAELENPYVDGITFSGGDPLHPKNYNTILWLCSQVKQKFPTKNIWIYTGYDLEDIKYMYEDILDYADVIVDGKFIDKLKSPSKHWVGSSNQRVNRRGIDF